MSIRIREVLSVFLAKEKSIRGVALLVGGTSAGQLLAVIASPLLTRLYSPADFGTFGVFGAILAMASVIAAFRYEVAIPLAENAIEAKHIAVLSLSAVVITALSISLLIQMCGATLVELLGVPALDGYIWFLPVSVAFTGLYQVLYYCCVREKQFGVIAAGKIKQTITMLGGQVCGYPLGLFGLIMGQIAGQLAAVVAFLLAHPAHTCALRSFGISWHSIIAIGKRYRRFPMYDLWYGLFNTAGIQLVPIMFVMFFGPSAAGLYILAHRVLSVPMSTIGAAVANVFLSRAAHAHRDGTIGGVVHKVHTALGTFAMPPAIMLMIAGPELFTVVFGANWQAAGELAQWLAPWLYTSFITGPISTIFAVTERQVEGAIFQALLLAGRIAAIYIGAAFDNMFLAAALFTTVSVVLFICLLVRIYLILDIPLVWLIKSNVSALISGLIITFPMIAVFSVSSQLSFQSLAVAASCALASFRYMNILRETK